jgi:RIO kinase 2
MDIRMLRYLSPTDFRLLTAVEMGMKNHELVPTALVVAIARVHGVGVHKRLRDLAQYRLVAYERGASCELLQVVHVHASYSPFVQTTAIV